MNTEESPTLRTELQEPQRPGHTAAPAHIRHLLGFAERRGPWLAILVLFAAIYFGSYYRHGINFRDEGGTVALLSKRLLEGQRPFLDVELGYNVGWFYPVVGLFKMFGVNFVLLRAYCFALSTLTAVLAFLTVERVSRRPWFAFLVGLMLILVPGMTFKNYVPLSAVANAFCLVHFALAGIPLRTKKDALEEAEDLESVPSKEGGESDGRGFWRWLSIGSVVLGLTLLIRVDIGIFVTLLWLGAIALQMFDSSVPLGKRLGRMIGGPLLLALIVTAVHLPVVLDAQRRGFAEPFLAQYSRWPKSIVISLTERFAPHARPSAPAVPPPPQSTALDQSAVQSPEAPEAGHLVNREILHRMTWRDIFTAKNADAEILLFLLYAPLLTLIPLTLWALARLRLAVRRKDRETLHRSLAALVALGAALTAFPQYFFFRPDAPHLSEFSPGFWVAVTSSLALLGAFDGSLRRRRWVTTLFCLVLLIHAACFLWRMFPDRWTGTIAARKNRTHFFHGANGVNVFLTKRESEGLTSLVKVISDHAKPGEYLLVYPYHPAVNLVTNLPTYEIDLYVDNATRSKTWEAGAINRLERYQPAAIVLSDWAINGTDSSRFSVWAARTKAWIQAHYDFQGIYMDREQFEVYTRRPAPSEPQLGQ